MKCAPKPYRQVRCKHQTQNRNLTSDACHAHFQVHMSSRKWPTRSVNTFCTRARLHSASANQQQFAAAQPSMSKPPRKGQAATPKASHAPIMPRTYQPPSVTVTPYIPCRKLPPVAQWQRLRPPHDQVPAPTPAQAARELVRCCSCSSRAPLCPGLPRQISRQCCPTGRRHYSLLVAATPEAAHARKRSSHGTLPGAGGPQNPCIGLLPLCAQAVTHLRAS